MNDVVDFIKQHGTDENNPVSSKRITRELGTNDTTVRKCVNLARCEGIPICTSHKGYFYSTDKNDILKTVNHLSSKIESMQNAIDGLMCNL